jgi:hypothetical protein
MPKPPRMPRKRDASSAEPHQPRGRKSASSTRHPRFRTLQICVCFSFLARAKARTRVDCLNNIHTYKLQSRAQKIFFCGRAFRPRTNAAKGPPGVFGGRDFPWTRDGIFSPSGKPAREGPARPERYPARWRVCGSYVVARRLVTLIKSCQAFETMVLQERIELSTSPLPRECSTTELLQRLWRAKGARNRPASCHRQGAVARRRGRIGLHQRQPSANASARSTIALKASDGGISRFSV